MPLKAQDLLDIVIGGLVFVLHAIETLDHVDHIRHVRFGQRCLEQIGGKPTPGIGFAMWLDRLSLMLEERFEARPAADIYIASMGDVARHQALLLAERIRDALPGVRVMVHCSEGKFKAQLKKADASLARVALVIGDEEVASDAIGVKQLRGDGQQASVRANDIIEHLQTLFS